jgi:hypothetical protein
MPGRFYVFLKGQTSNAPQSGTCYDIGTVEDHLGHKDVMTAMIYTHVLNGGANRARTFVIDSHQTSENLIAVSCFKTIV